MLIQFKRKRVKADGNEYHVRAPVAAGQVGGRWSLPEDNFDKNFVEKVEYFRCIWFQCLSRHFPYRLRFIRTGV